MERALRQTVVIGPGGRFEGEAPELVPGTTAEIIVLYPEGDATSGGAAEGWARHWAASDRQIAGGMETWDLDRVNIELGRGVEREIPLTHLDYLDSGIVLAAWRGGNEAKPAARAYLEDGSRPFLSCDALRLETWPKAAFRKNQEEMDFYRFVFSKVARWVPIDDALVEDAIHLGERYDVTNLDALHAAAAIRAGADRFVTTERPGRPLHRLAGIEVVHLLDPTP